MNEFLNDLGRKIVLSNKSLQSIYGGNCDDDVPYDPTKNPYSDQYESRPPIR